MVVERRLDGAYNLLLIALLRDMGGAHASALMALGSEEIVLDPPHGVSEGFARAFARFVASADGSARFSGATVSIRILRLLMYISLTALRYVSAQRWTALVITTAMP